MSYLDAVEKIKTYGAWEIFLVWFVAWFEDNMENEESLLETTTIMYAEGLE